MLAASAMPPRSAAMLITFAMTSRAQAPQSTHREYRLRITLARPRPVTSPSRAHMSCAAVIRGNENRAVQSGAYPNAAPATEYVEMPEGSSSAAPVIRPGPRFEKNRWNWPRLSGCGTVRLLERGVIRLLASHE